MTAPDLLETIVAASERISAIREERTPLRTLEASIRRQSRGDLFAAALRSTVPPRVIAECKRRSPSRGILREDYDAPAHARAYARGGAAAISVLTEPTFFDGAPDHLTGVRQAVDLPLLRKDFIVSEYQLVESAALGADAVLLIAGALDVAELSTLRARSASLGLAALVEVHDRAELETAVDAGATIIGVNSRNLRTLAVDPDLHEKLIGDMPAGVTAVAESGIRTREDLARLAAAGYHAFLVGERLIAHADVTAALREMRGDTC